MHLDLERIKLKLQILIIFFPDLTGRRLKIFEKIWTGIKITSSKKCQARISIESGGIRIQIKRKLRPRSSINTYGRVGSLTSPIKIQNTCLRWSSEARWLNHFFSLSDMIFHLSEHFLDSSAGVCSNKRDGTDMRKYRYTCSCTNTSNLNLLLKNRIY